MAPRKPFLLRIDRRVLDAVQRWADDDLRSVNAQIDWLLRDALRRAGRSLAAPRAEADETNDTDNAEATEATGGTDDTGTTEDTDA